MSQKLVNEKSAELFYILSNLLPYAVFIFRVTLLPTVGLVSAHVIKKVRDS